MKRWLTTFFCVALLYVAGPAAADDVADITVSLSEPTVEKSYDLIAGAMPYQLVTPELWTPSICRDAAYCDVIDLTLDLPARIPEIWGISITLTWANAQDDNDLFLFDEDEVMLARSTKSTGTDENVKLLEPDPRLFYIVILHWGGPNTGYKVKVEYTVTDLGDPGEYNRPQRGGARGDQDDSAPAFNPRAGAARPALGPSDAAPAPVKVPGEDGNPTEYTLPVVQTRGVTQRDDGSPVVTVIVVSILAVIGAGVLTLLVRKRRAEA